MFCMPGLIFGGTEGVRSHFHVLCSRLVFDGTDLFSAVPRASGPVFMICSPGLIFGGTEGIRSHFHVLCSQAHFRRYGGRRVSISCFAQPDSFSAVPSVSGPVIMFCAPRTVSGGTEGVGSRFHVLRVGTRFRRYRGRWVPFTYFALPDSSPTLPGSSGLVYMFWALRIVFGGTMGVGSRFHVLRALTRFLRNRGRRLPFSCFAFSDSFHTVPWASGHVFMF
jgi:hypothetical protein